MVGLVAGFVAGGAIFGFLGYVLGRLSSRAQSAEERLGPLEIQELLAPLGDSLSQVQTSLRDLDRERAVSHASLREQLSGLRTETASLARALRNPATRGRWGEIQLRRVVEMAGMLEHCDFEEQRTEAAGPSGPSGEDKRLRPDLQIRLPGGKTVIVDAKVPCDAYLDAADAVDEAVREARLRSHARQLREHVTALGSKAYWDELPSTPDFVVLFLPGEPLLSAAWERDSALLDYALSQSVMLATPTTLIALLKAVAYGWRQEKIATSAHEIGEQGRALYRRASILARHFDDLGRSLGQAVSAFNRAVGSLEGGVLVTARRFKELGIAAPESIRELRAVERLPRSVRPGSLSNEEPAGS